MTVDEERIQKLNQAPDRPDRAYVLYWSQMNRRVDANHALLHAASLANRYKLPVLFYEGLTHDYPYANDRLHRFVLEGVPDTARRLKKAGIGYAFYLRKTARERNDALYELAKNAAAVVTDDYPVFIARRNNERVPQKLDVSYYAVDSSCVVPMSVIPSRQYGAYTIRPRIHRVLDKFLKRPPALRVNRRFADKLPAFHTEVTEDNIGSLTDACEINHSVPPSAQFHGGRLAAERLLARFLHENLRRYAQFRNEPSENATSLMSPYLHFGQISSLEVALRVMEYAQEHKLMYAEFLEELIVRRELAFNYARFTDDPGSLRNLPDWCQENMKKHARDKRDPQYTPRQFETAKTHDELWNATQTEMRTRGKIHGYYRMYWGKKIIEWSRSYEEAAQTMIDIHGRYALDGRDPNTYTNILWCFGLHDRPWPERPIFGSFRSMTLEGMERKTNVRAYIDGVNGKLPTQRPLWTT